MCVMEDSDLQITSDFKGTVAVVNETIENNVTEIEDDRIPCHSSESLNKTLQITISKVTNIAQAHKVEDSQSKFTARFTEVFCDVIRNCVSVDGLPWVVSFDGLTSREREQQELETDDARLSQLSKQVERVAWKRKTTASECARIREIRYKHQRQNLRKRNVETSVSCPAIPVFPELFPHEELAQICRDLNIANTKVRRVGDELPSLEKNLKIAQDILKRQNAHLEEDTGYMSS